MPSIVYYIISNNAMFVGSVKGLIRFMLYLITRLFVFLPIRQKAEGSHHQLFMSDEQARTDGLLLVLQCLWLVVLNAKLALEQTVV